MKFCSRMDPISGQVEEGLRTDMFPDRKEGTRYCMHLLKGFLQELVMNDTPRCRLGTKVGLPWGWEPLSRASSSEICSYNLMYSLACFNELLKSLMLWVIGLPVLWVTSSVILFLSYKVGFLEFTFMRDLRTFSSNRILSWIGTFLNCFKVFLDFSILSIFSSKES